ncbi:MAG: hypothetical protein KatS3mg013_0475 [Actinomycetota bacterium]|nr:MAG: hypothetical protein KatS3mg013_0475 [Actinomycetota bacterium]
MRRTLTGGLVTAMLALVACTGGAGGGEGDDPGPPSPTGMGTATATAPPGEGSPTAPTPTEEPAGSALVGVWTIDLQDKLRALLAPYGGVPAGLSCRGAENLLFGEDGAFLATLNGRCRFLDKSGSVQGEQAGEFRDQGDAFVLHHVVGRLSGEIQGIAVPLAAWDTTTRPVPYRVDGDELTITVAMPGGARVELVYRAA